MPELMGRTKLGMTKVRTGCSDITTEEQMMSKSLNEVEKQVHVAEVVHHGEKLTIPVGMGVQDAIDLLERRRDYLSEKVIIRREFNVFPWDGANALAQALTNRFGWAAAESTPGFLVANRQR
ncbi:hypothetical protein M5585_20000 [Serratia ureilytica]